MKINDLALNIDSFRQPIVAREDTYLSIVDEQDATMSYVRLMHQGTYFTGTVFEHGAEYRQLIEYQNGLLHGKNSFFNGKGAMTQEIIYDNNNEISSKTWHEENGALGSVWGHNYYTSWYADGLLFYEKRHDPKTQSSEETFYFRNGKSQNQRLYPKQRAVLLYLFFQR